MSKNSRKISHIISLQSKAPKIHLTFLFWLFNCYQRDNNTKMPIIYTQKLKAPPRNSNCLTFLWLMANSLALMCANHVRYIRGYPIANN